MRDKVLLGYKVCSVNVSFTGTLKKSVILGSMENNRLQSVLATSLYFKSIKNGIEIIGFH